MRSRRRCGHLGRVDTIDVGIDVCRHWCYGLLAGDAYIWPRLWGAGSASMLLAVAATAKLGN